MRNVLSVGATAVRSPVASLLLILPLAGCGPSLLDPQGSIGAAEKSILLDSLAIMLAIVLPTIAATLGFAWWFRAGNGRARRLPGFVYSGRIELIVWAIPLLTITLLGGVAWIGSHRLDPANPIRSSEQAMDVQVVSLDWKWLFIYPEQHVASVNRVVVPAGRPVHFTLTSASVMNSFFVIQLGSQIYTMNGMATQLNLQADQPGSYHGLSTHFSGDGFSDMTFTLDAVPPEQFASWVAEARANGPALDRGSYAELARQSRKVKPFTYRQVDPALFDAVVAQQVAPGPGPKPSVTPVAEH